jgi:hypothetical protein
MDEAATDANGAARNGVDGEGVPVAGERHRCGGRWARVGRE